MIRKTLIGLATVFTLAVGFGSSAEAKVFVSIGIGHPYHHGYFFHHCAWRNAHVKVWNHRQHRWVWVWTKRRVCW
jgi:hypothetical protein